MKRQMSQSKSHPYHHVLDGATATAPLRAWTLLAVVLLGVAGCVAPAPETQGGKLYHHNWWNYYARGMYFLEQNRTEEAMADFQRSLGVIPGAKFGNARDLWRARTYGLHFMEGYFPNRELGVCLFERNDHTQAIQYLEKSLQQEPTGRAKYYLNLARQKEMTGHAVPAPRIQIDQSDATSYTRERSLALSGTVAGEGCVRHLAVGGRAEFIELAMPTMPFARRIPLVAGTNIVKVVAEDLLGQQAVRQVVRIADWQPPRFQIRRVSMQNGEWLVEGVCRDESGVASISLGATPVYRHSGKGASAEKPVTLRVPATGAILIAYDIAGNRLACTLTATAFAQSAFRPDRPTHLVQPATVLEQMASWKSLCRQSSGRSPKLRFTAQNLSVVNRDRMRPVLTLGGCLPLTRVFSDDFFVDGTAADGGGLASVTVNGENLLAPEDQGSIRSYFARHIMLDPGTNRFEIVVTDRSGNTTARELTVVRIRPEYLEDRYRLSVGVPPLTPVQTEQTGIRVKRSMESELTREPVRFQLLERDEGWDFVLREQGLSVSDLADPAAALRIGKMVPAEMLLMGKIINEAKGITVYLKAVETGNGEVVFASDVYSPAHDARLDEAVTGLILKVKQGFPLITGEVLRCQGSHVTLNVGRQAGTLEKSRFLVLNSTATESAGDGQVCKKNGQPVQLKVERVQQKTSIARIIPSEADAIVKEGFYVYTR